MIETVENLKKDKEKLECDILELVRKFEKKYGIYVSELDSEYEIIEMVDGGKHLQTSNVHVNINI